MVLSTVFVNAFSTILIGPLAAKKVWAIPGLLFAYCWTFLLTFQNTNCRVQRDLSSDCWSRRRARWPFGHYLGPIRTLWGTLMIKYLKLAIALSSRPIQWRHYLQNSGQKSNPMTSCRTQFLYAERQIYFLTLNCFFFNHWDICYLVLNCI